MSEQVVQQTLEAGTYEVIRDRLKNQREALEQRLHNLNEARKGIFGSTETKLIAQNRMVTENNCVAQDIVAFGNLCILGYNVHFGLRTDIGLQDVFSIYRYTNGEFVAESLDFLHDQNFINDFGSLYKYYRSTRFYRFIVIGNYLYLVFQLSERVTDIKTFKWLIQDDKITYIDNRSDFEYRFPPQHDFEWVTATRDMHKYGRHPHIAILNKVFVDTLGGTLTIKVEDNTNEGEGIYNEPVANADQTLDDGTVEFADLGNLIALSIKPFQEDARYYVYNHKLREVKKIGSIKHAAILLPDQQGIIFSNGYYLQSGEYKIFETSLEEVTFQERLSSPNGEDFLYIFFQKQTGRYVLMMYNVITQTVGTPIICNGYALLDEGRLCYFVAEADQTRSHVVQVWQTPFTDEVVVAEAHRNSLLFKIGNKAIVRAMAECRNLIVLLNKEDTYNGLYADLVRASQNILDGYFWIQQEETFAPGVPVAGVRATANTAIDEFEKVTAQRQAARHEAAQMREKAEQALSKIKSTSFRSIEDFTTHLTALRNLRGEVISRREVRYIDLQLLAGIEKQLVEQSDRLSRHCVEFLNGEMALEPFAQRVAAQKPLLEAVTKVVDGKKLEIEANAIGSDLELLIEVVSNLKIEDTSQATRIIDNISLIFTGLNQLKAAIRNKVEALATAEAGAEFAAQIKLLEQTIINYLDVADSPEKTDTLLNRLSVQMEELESRFAGHDTFLAAILEKREEATTAFDNRKAQLLEARNKRAIGLETAARRILKGIEKKAATLDSQDAINGYFAADLMVTRLRDTVQQLRDLDDAGRAETIDTAIKAAREEALRRLKDKQELYEDGENIIKLGNHRFAVNRQPLDLTMVLKEDSLYYHLTGTDFYEPVHSELLSGAARFWGQPLISENEQVYRSAYLAWKLLQQHGAAALHGSTDAALQKLIADETARSFDEGYTKGVHDADALKLLKCLIAKYHALGLLRFTPADRVVARLFWESLEAAARQQWLQRIQAAGEVLQVFAASNSHQWIIDGLRDALINWLANVPVAPVAQPANAAAYLFYELKTDDHFAVSIEALEAYEAMVQLLQQNGSFSRLRLSMEALHTPTDKMQLALQWTQAFCQESPGFDAFFIPEAALLLMLRHEGRDNLIAERTAVVVEGLTGNHTTIVQGTFTAQYHHWVALLEAFIRQEVPAYLQFRQARHQLIVQKKEALRLQEFEPKVLSSFVRNKLINEVYLPLIGNNLARQLGTSGETRRTDRSGMLLLVSPPGYGKTTLMEYTASRLGLIFMKINGPALGHSVTNVDPASATNSAAREELKKLNLALEMGNNVMLYVDDIQHCHPEFLQKFISLADGTRRMEGVHNRVPRTYDMRGRRFCVVMAGNPYTESGDKFKIPDMLANRSDIYNLGDIIGNSADLFRLSLIENAVTSNPLLNQLAGKNYNDLYRLTDAAEKDETTVTDLEGNHTKQEVETYLNLLKKVVAARNVVLQVNALYIASAAQDDAYRTEPPFKLQGSYRDMNKLISKVVPVMNDAELQDLLLTHYRNESQTLTTAAEANMLRLRQLMGILTADEADRWASIKDTFLKNNKLKGAGEGQMAMLLQQVIEFTGHLGVIKEQLLAGKLKE